MFKFAFGLLLGASAMMLSYNPWLISTNPLVAGISSYNSGYVDEPSLPSQAGDYGSPASVAINESAPSVPLVFVIELHEPRRVTFRRKHHP